MPRTAVLARFALLAFLAATGSSFAAEPARPPYLVGVGDVLRVAVWKNADISGDFLVRPDGILTLPLAGDIPAAGLSPAAIGEKVAERLRAFLEAPVVTVILLNPASNQVFILGEVARPGAYPLSASLTILQGLALAGGFTAFADRDALVLLRQGEAGLERKVLRFADLTAEPSRNRNLPLQRGDTLIVP